MAHVLSIAPKANDAQAEFAIASQALGEPEAETNLRLGPFERVGLPDSGTKDGAQQNFDWFPPMQKGAIGGCVITYTVNGAQKVAVAAGSTMLAWPTKIVTAKVVVLGLDSASAKQ